MTVLHRRQPSEAVSIALAQYITHHREELEDAARMQREAQRANPHTPNGKSKMKLAKKAIGARQLRILTKAESRRRKLEAATQEARYALDASIAAPPDALNNAPLNEPIKGE